MKIQMGGGGGGTDPAVLGRCRYENSKCPIIRTGPNAAGSHEIHATNTRNAVMLCARLDKRGRIAWKASPPGF